MIILEGPDGTGKSTLVKRISEEFSLKVKSGEGPPKDKRDFVDRVNRYLALPSPMLFDRHPLISGPIYAVIRGEKPGINKNQLIDFYSRPKLVILTKPSTPDLFNHEVKAYDTEEHLGLLAANSAKIGSMYRALSKCPDFHEVDPLGPWQIIKALVNDYLKRI